MTHLNTLTFDENARFLRRLSHAGFSTDTIREVIRHQDLAKAMLDAVLRQTSHLLVHDLFTPPKQQIEAIARWNHAFGWGLPDRAFLKVKCAIPNWPKDQLTALVLVPYLTDKKDHNGNAVSGIERTFHELWKCAKSRQDAGWRYEGLCETNPGYLYLLKGARHRPGLRWEIIDLESHRNKRPCSARSAISSPHAGILAAAALHPTWIKSMDGGKVPYVWIPGYEIRSRGLRSKIEIPGLSYAAAERKIRLSCTSNQRYPNWAVPEFFCG
jgi:hypothetical protein